MGGSDRNRLAWAVDPGLFHHRPGVLHENAEFIFIQTPVAVGVDGLVGGNSKLISLRTFGVLQ